MYQKLLLYCYDVIYREEVIVNQIVIEYMLFMYIFFVIEWKNFMNFMYIKCWLFLFIIKFDFYYNQCRFFFCYIFSFELDLIIYLNIYVYNLFQDVVFVQNMEFLRINEKCL